MHLVGPLLDRSVSLEHGAERRRDAPRRSDHGRLAVVSARDSVPEPALDSPALAESTLDWDEAEVILALAALESSRARLRAVLAALDRQTPARPMLTLIQGGKSETPALRVEV